jgi:hypothetical protein
VQAEPNLITYWFLYGYSSPGRRLLPIRVARELGHEGDWERISISFNGEGNPRVVSYYQHKGPAHEFFWETVFKFETHPVVFSPAGSHASYPALHRDRAA